MQLARKPRKVKVISFILVMNEALIVYGYTVLEMLEWTRSGPTWTTSGPGWTSSGPGWTTSGPTSKFFFEI